MTVGQICNREVIIAERTDSVTEVAKLMRNNHVGTVIVAARNRGITQPLGIITDRDLVLEVLSLEVDPNKIYAEDLMSSVLHCGNESDSVWATIKTMRSKGVRRVPILDDEGSLVGMLAMDDVVDLLANELSSLVNLISREQSNESLSREFVD